MRTKGIPVRYVGEVFRSWEAHEQMAREQFARMKASPIKTPRGIIPAFEYWEFNHPLAVRSRRAERWNVGRAFRRMRWMARAFPDFAWSTASCLGLDLHRLNMTCIESKLGNYREVYEALDSPVFFDGGA